jgi:NAD(P)H-dependent FMN reductase
VTYLCISFKQFWLLIGGTMVVAVLLGSVRSERMGDRAAKWAITQLEKRGHEAVLVDAGKLELPMLDKMWKEVGPAHGPHAPDGYGDLKHKLAPLAELYARADGFCIVSAEYNHSVPSGMSNLIDYFLEEYFWRPSAIISYSATPFGGVRAAMQLRALLAETGMPSIPSIQPIPQIGSALTEDGVPLTQQLAEKSGKFFDEFDWYMRAFKAERGRGLPY